jgi:hypothetical protein
MKPPELDEATLKPDGATLLPIRATSKPDGATLVLDRATLVRAIYFWCPTE